MTRVDRNMADYLTETLALIDSVPQCLSDLEDTIKSPFPLSLTAVPVFSMVTRVRAISKALVDMTKAENHYACLILSRVLFEDSLLAVASKMHERGMTGLIEDTAAGKRITQISLSGKKYTYSKLCDEQDAFLGNSDDKSRDIYSFLSKHVHFSSLSALSVLGLCEHGGPSELAIPIPSHHFRIQAVSDDHLIMCLSIANNTLLQVESLLKQEIEILLRMYKEQQVNG